MKWFVLQFEDSKTNWRVPDDVLSEVLAELLASAGRCQSDGPIPRATVFPVEHDNLGPLKSGEVLEAVLKEGYTK